MARIPLIAQLGIGICIVGGVILFIWPGGGCDKNSARRTACLSSLKQIGLGFQIYAADHEDRLPLGSSWYTVSKSRFDMAPFCPIVKTEHPDGIGYAYNALYSAAKQSRIKNQETTMLVYESTSIAPNSADPGTSLPTPGRHDGKNNIGYVDGHAKSVKQP